MPPSPLCPDGERVTLSVDTYGDDDRLPPGCVRIDVLYQTSGSLSCLQREEVSKALRAILRRAILDERRGRAAALVSLPLPPPMPPVAEPVTGTTGTTGVAPLSAERREAILARVRERMSS